MSDSSTKYGHQGKTDHLVEKSCSLDVMAPDDASLTGSYCLSAEGEMVRPRVLPCKHVFCTPCLQTDSQANQGKLKCPNCRSEVKQTIKKLPAYLKEKSREESKYCDTCQQKGIKEQQPDVFCVHCSKKFCKKHKELHEELMPEHGSSVMSIADYQKQSKKLALRFCPKHADSRVLITLACRECKAMFCSDCEDHIETCETDRPGYDGFRYHQSKTQHKIVPLKQMTSQLRANLEGFVNGVCEKEEKYKQYTQNIELRLQEYDKATAEITALIKAKCLIQIRALKENYNKLEMEATEERQKVRNQITTFKDTQIQSNLENLHRLSSQLTTYLTEDHDVDIISLFDPMKDDVNSALKEPMPHKSIYNVCSLKEQGERRVPELAVTKDSCLSFDFDKPHASKPRPPQRESGNSHQTQGRTMRVLQRGRQCSGFYGPDYGD